MTRKEAERQVYQQCGNCAFWMADSRDGTGKPLGTFAQCSRCHYVGREFDDWCKQFKASPQAIRAIMEAQEKDQ